MEALPREILHEITKRLSLVSAACLARTNKSFNGSIWSLITTLNEEDSKKIKESTKLEKFDNLEALLFNYLSTMNAPQDLIKLTTLQKLNCNVAHSTVLQKLTNLRELNVSYGLSDSDNLGDLLLDHTRLTKLSLSDNIHQLDPFSWTIMTRLRYLNLLAHNTTKLPASYFSPLWSLTQLRGLGLTSIILDQADPETGLSKLINLEELHIFGCKLRDEYDGDCIFNYNELLDLKLTTLAIMDVKVDQNLIDVIATMTQLLRLDLYEPDDEYQLSRYSNLKNLTRIWFGNDIVKSDPGLDFTQIPNLEVVSIPWCPNVTQLVHLKNLRELFLRKGGSQTDDQMLNFLNKLTTLRELALSTILLPSDGVVEMKGMTNLMYLELTMYVDTNKSGLHKFIQGLSVVPLVYLNVSDVNQELFHTIATSLTQLRTLKLPKKGRSLFKEDTTKYSTLPSYNDFNFRIEFREW